ncbi:polynucleotide 3'-phosphatase /polynucleotide 5'-hydroxyl-kinase /polynucleotide 2',3'-cyclic phosphate phosphodiesterase [Sanguibacter gelidistatuariae]|uniref:Polynucleotide 3'-phosphatase /polynucleotide 5'-hydroxyl-kinase /polynucleotide 2',3'-cyclic phosphate phosphodiesterase n=1 Tax=Sanguibacter gelidistatuariae TaxID=1814289 RepID=A0A1G6X719_9MICO|nr:polynucleotide kinase-phosphatase [Sanguibacter gelidistatuariae]SDD73643.1 polynucleotide 3'-phosphatase /polynucleotide 5'-hydroxyl-kinase /polynucleotide 2',3'-cyclic phosphate phosphodiesterase [Sanguibacter gelidistatuariae]
MTEISVPDLSLIVLVGASGSGKSTFAATHFGAFETVSSDFCRGLVSNDENSQEATADAFDLLAYIVGKRLDAGLLTVVDATNVQPHARKSLAELARAHDVLPVAVVLDVGEDVCLTRNAARADRSLPAHVVRRQREQLRRSLRGLGREGFRDVHVLHSAEEVEATTIVRHPLRSDRRTELGPFDVIGDVHGCRSELESLLVTLGYTLVHDDAGRPVDAVPPEGRRAVFLGDLVDRGPDSPGVLRLVMGIVAAGHALAVPGNHENKLVRALDGRKVQVSHGLAETLAQLAEEPEEFRRDVRAFCDGLVAHLVLDEGRLVVAHAGLKEAYHGRASGRVRSFALYGETTGETDEFGLPVRYPWAEDYRGRATVLYGHTPTPVAHWVNNTMCLDTGVVFGGHLSALRYPEREVVQVPAERVWYEPVKPFPVAGSEAGVAVAESGGNRTPDLLDVTDVLGKRVVETRTHGRVGIAAENAAGALEVMSRFALDPRWLLYLPPTMSPCATSSRDGLLEHPAEAFAQLRADGVDQAVCEEKHMGSRAVVLVCRDQETASSRFSIPEGMTGVVHTRTGRSFLDDARTEELLRWLRSAADAAGTWKTAGVDGGESGWLLFDCELMPWSLKAEPLLREQYASVGAAARSALPAAVRTLETAERAGLPVGDLLARTRSRATNAEGFADAYRRYAWAVDGLDGVRLAPFQLLAAEGSTFHDRDHLWHLGVVDELVAADTSGLLQATRRLVVDLDDEGSVAAGTAWWEELTGAGGEGMVVKPVANLVRGRRGLVQPGIKVRGREYLRIIYGPDYTEPEHLARLRERGLGRKRSLALREYALGIEALERFRDDEPLWRVHEAVFAVLALESEPVDPRL